MKIEPHNYIAHRGYRIVLPDGTCLAGTIIKADEETGECDLIIDFMPRHFSFGAGGFRIIKGKPDAEKAGR